VFLVSFLGGWKFGFLSALLPACYRFYIGGPMAIYGVIQGIILAVVIGSLFHRSKEFTPPITVIHIKRMLGGYLVFETVKSLWMYYQFHLPLDLLMGMIVFGTLSILVIAVMMNDFSKSFIQKREMEYQSNYDFLTDLPNIRCFNREAAKVMRTKTSVAIVMFDVDYFLREILRYP
jgi:diguanylate cyclase